MGLLLERRRALVICSGTFADSHIPALTGVRADYSRVVRCLQGDQASFEVTAFQDGAFLELRRAVAKLCADSTAQDTLLIYYSGSSFQDSEGRLFLPAHDSEAAYPEATALDTDFILGQLRRTACRRSIILVDGCHAGSFFVGNRGIPNGLFFIGACGPDQMVKDSDSGGAFTQVLVEGIESPRSDKDGDGRVSIDELHEFVAERLAEAEDCPAPYKWACGVDRPIFIAAAAPRVFLSYAREDNELASTLRSHLEHGGMDVWIDREGVQSGNWKQRVMTALERARAVVLLLTPNSLISEPVQRELEFAKLKGVPLLPVVYGVPRPIDNYELPNWYEFDYGSIHRHEIEPAAPEAGVSKLLASLRSVRPSVRRQEQPLHLFR